MKISFFHGCWGEKKGLTLKGLCLKRQKLEICVPYSNHWSPSLSLTTKNNRSFRISWQPIPIPPADVAWRAGSLESIPGLTNSASDGSPLIFLKTAPHCTQYFVILCLIYFYKRRTAEVLKSFPCGPFHNFEGRRIWQFKSTWFNLC